MLRTKMMLLTVVVVALAVPSLWAQKERLVRPKPAADGSAVCVAIPAGAPPAGYYASTNKCSSGNVNYGGINSKQPFVDTLFGQRGRGSDLPIGSTRGERRRRGHVAGALGCHLHYGHCRKPATRHLSKCDKPSHQDRPEAQPYAGGFGTRSLQHNRSDLHCDLSHHRG